MKHAFLRPKGNLTRTEIWVLAAVAVVPLLMMALRIMALPGVPSLLFGGEFLRSIGSALNQTLSLSSVPPDDRNRILYLLLVPMSALLVALARLTFGIKVLGFRSILISVGFQHSGIVPSLVLMAIAVATVVTVRPWLRRARLPYYARVSVIVCVVATTMVAAVVVAPWVRSDVLWAVAYFPVIVLAMLAEGIAHTLDHGNIKTAAWRAVTTVALAFLIALLCRIPALRDTMLQFPELVLTQIVAIVFIAEFLDFRFLQDWDQRLGEAAQPHLLADAGRYHVAVVRNRPDSAIIGRMGRRTPNKEARRSVQKIVDALRAGGHTVQVVDGDAHLMRELNKFIPPDPHTGAPGGIVLNLAYGIQGHGRALHVPAMLEMAGIAYTGPSPVGHAQMLDHAVRNALLQEAGVLTPRSCLIKSPKDRIGDLAYPLTVRPRCESKSRRVHDRDELRTAVKTVVRRYRQEAFVEEHLRGRWIVASILGNDPAECLPLVEIDARARRKICPARLDSPLAKQIRADARTAYFACGCRDFGRIDFRLGPTGTPYVTAVSTLGILNSQGCFAIAAAEAGYSFPELLGRILETARARYAGRQRIRRTRPAPEGTSDEAPVRAGIALGERGHG